MGEIIIRVIRFSLKEIQNFKIQLSALIKANQFGSLGILFPMVTIVEEFITVKNMYKELYKEIKKVKPRISNDIEIGLMVETTTTTLLANKFSRYADFLSIETNDLNSVHHERLIERMKNYLIYISHLTPSISKLIKIIIDGAHENDA